jgi:hypothetical protein
MGHIRLGLLPSTKKWRRLVGYIGCGAEAPQVAASTLAAAEKGLATAHKDVGVVETVWLLMQLPHAARTDDFAGGLRACGLAVSDEPGLMEVIGAAVEAVEAKTPNCRGRTDLGELARMSLGDTIASVIGGHVHGLFETTAADVQAAFGRHTTVKQFGDLAHDFFTRFTGKFLNYYLSRALPLEVGEGRRFGTLADKAAFDAELGAHCRDRARVVERFAGEWLSKERWESDGELSRDAVRKFVYGAVRKITDGLKAGGPA